MNSKSTQSIGTMTRMLMRRNERSAENEGSTKLDLKEGFAREGGKDVFCN